MSKTFEKWFEELAPGDGFETRGRTITESDVVQFAALSGDMHPQHTDRHWAADGPFGERIAHGMLVLSYALALMPLDPERIVALRGIDRAVFKRPVALGDTIAVAGAVRGLTDLDSGHGLVTTDLRVKNHRGELVARCAVERGLAPGAGRGRRRRRGGDRDRASLRPDPALMLAGKRLLITGVVTRHSIAWVVAERAQQAGAEVVLTGFGRGRRLTERAARGLPEPPDVLELDVNEPADIDALHDELESRWGGLDGVLHAIAFAPPDALGGAFIDTPADSASQAFVTSAYSFKALAGGLRPLLAREQGSVVGLDFDASSGLARLRLDGRREGWARIGLSLPRSRSRARWHTREPDLSGPAGDPRRRRDPRLRHARRAVGRAGSSRLGLRRRRRGGRRGVLSPVGLVHRHDRRDPSRRRRLPRDGCSDAPGVTRTPTPNKRDKALNLARLPIPPQARSGRGL